MDIVPTILQALEVPLPTHRIEGRALQPLLHGATQAPWRDCVFSELDYSFRQARLLRGKTPQQARAWSARTDRWRYVYWQDEPEQLYDLANDPGELQDLAAARPTSGARRDARAPAGMVAGAQDPRHDRRFRHRAQHQRAQARGIHFGQW
ncbi:sulfatase [Bordetella pertussis]|nr:sulfatase [Bordetella pertussis]